MGLDRLNLSGRHNIELTAKVIAAKRLAKKFEKLYRRNLMDKQRRLQKVFERIVIDVIVEDIYKMITEMIENGSEVPYFTDQVKISIKNRNVNSPSYVYNPETNGNDFIFFVKFSDKLFAKKRRLYVGKFTKGYRSLLQNAIQRGNTYPYHTMKIKKK